MSQLSKLKTELNKLGSKKRAAASLWFFKTGKGQYGEGDVFIGITMPVQRQVVKKYSDLAISDIQQLLNSKIHEYRMVGLLMVVDQYKKADQVGKKKLYDFYLKNTRNINNWDLVDVTTPRVVGDYLLDKQRGILYKFTRSKNLWERRIAVLATFAFIDHNDFKDNLRIAEILLKDKHDLIHKAVGWGLREVGKRDQAAEERFLKKHYKVMPRTMLRYAIERFSDKKRKFYMKK